MPAPSVNTKGLSKILAISVLQWAGENGYGDVTVTDLLGRINGTSTGRSAKKKAAPVKKKNAAKKKAAPAKPKAKATPKKKAAPAKAKTTSKKTAPVKAKSTKATSVYDPKKIVSFIQKQGSAKAKDLKDAGLVPDNANARSKLMQSLIADKLITATGKARGTQYFPA